MQDIKGTIENLGLFVVAVIVASIIYGAIIVPIIYIILSRRNPLRLLQNMIKPMLTAFGACSRWVLECRMSHGFLYIFIDILALIN